jgi:3-phosphoshikimate 1-carboxyvinyltransferase
MEVEENRIVVPGGALQPPREAIRSHNDHRIVMAMSVLLSRLGGVIEGAEAVNKSFPDFFDRIQSIGIEVKRHETQSKL